MITVIRWVRTWTDVLKASNYSTHTTPSTDARTRMSREETSSGFFSTRQLVSKNNPINARLMEAGVAG